MRPLTRALWVAFIWGATAVAWLALGAVTAFRANHGDGIDSRVSELWGRAHVQQGPVVHRVKPALETPEPTGKPAPTAAPEGEIETELQSQRADLAVTLELDQRRKGLRWYSLYGVTFRGTYQFDLPTGEDDTFRAEFTLPDPAAIYDDFHVYVDDQERLVMPSQGRVTLPLDDCAPCQVTFQYRSRGADRWSYLPGPAGLRNFGLTMETNFSSIDFPDGTLSPTTRETTGSGSALTWSFSNVVASSGIGMTMPTRIQPGELSSALSVSAPISLGFFLVVIALLAKLRDIEIHPINYLLVAAAFFSFHLFFAYSVDRIPVEAAFAISSVVSVAMVTLYLRLVVSTQFGVVYAGALQLVYLVGFSAAHFFEGFTGLTVTVLSIATLFLMMMLTGRVKWADVLRTPRVPDPPQGPYRTPDPTTTS